MTLAPLTSLGPVSYTHLENFIKFAPHRTLARRVTFALNVSRILKQRQDALFSILREGVQIKQMVVGGRGIDFEVSRVNDDAERGGDGKRHATDDGVSDADELNFEGAEFDAVASFDFVEFRCV